MESYIGPITDSIINNIIKELQKKHNKKKLLEKIFNPLLSELTKKYFVHIISLTSILIINVVLSLFIIFLLLKK